MGWTQSPDIEIVPGKMSGQPALKGTRIRPETIVENFESGPDVEEIHANYPHIPVDTIRRILAFHHSHQLVR